MKLFKKVLAGVAVAAAMASAQASVINVGGVSWDPDSAIDFSTASLAIRQFIDPTTGVVSGFGTVNSLNGSTSFCAGCELTFQFGGFTPSSPVIPTVAGGSILYLGGFLNFYVDTTPELINGNVTTLTAASTGAGSLNENLLWLSVVGKNVNPGSGLRSFVGSIESDGFGGVSSLKGSGLLDVTGGAAAGNLDTNTKAFGSDFAFTTSFTTFVDGSLLNSVGTGNFNGNSIPEPESLALVGLGLLGLAAARRRKAA